MEDQCYRLYDITMSIPTINFFSMLIQIEITEQHLVFLLDRIL